jgi:hypothetical protein
MRRCGNISKALQLVAIAGFSLLTAAQVRTSTSTASIATRQSAGKTPYTAEYKIEQVQTLDNGTTITRETTEVHAVDAQGRSMNSTTSTLTAGSQTKTFVHVFDPVTHTITHWDVPGNKVTVRSLGANHTCTPAQPEPRAAHSPMAHEKPTVEKLGLASIQGIEARGTRTTFTIPAGEVGNDAPLVRTTENWNAIAVGLNGLLVREITEDPRSGKWDREMTNIDQREPDPSVFQPPDGYQIVEEKTTETCPTESEPAK